MVWMLNQFGLLTAAQLRVDKFEFNPLVKFLPLSLSCPMHNDLLFFSTFCNDNGAEDIHKPKERERGREEEKRVAAAYFDDNINGFFNGWSNV
jgi:hypothetical protein